MYKYYLKKVSKQDVERTTIINAEAASAFFGVTIPNRDDSATISLKYLPDNKLNVNVIITRKQDIRIFIERERFKENDILLFEKLEKNIFSLSVINTKNSEYYKLINIMNNNYLLSDTLIEEKDEFILNQFAKWLISKDGITHNYYSRTFSNDINKLLLALKKYDDIYFKQFKIKLFEFDESEITEFIRITSENIYQENGLFYEFSKKTSKHMPRAILGEKNYLTFLKLIENKYIYNNLAIDFDSTCKSTNLNFSNKLINRFIASLCTKPFVILSGLSGSGKTKLAQAFVQWICESNKQYKIVPVGADWTNREPLLGYPNGLAPKDYVMPDSGALQLIIDATKNESKPYFLILDEMNLSHVERYFADFLSIMESKDCIKLYDGNERSCNNQPIQKEIYWPKNLFVIGTVNIDETTYMFSPKVLDRANVIEFRITETEMRNYLAEVKEINMDMLLDKGIKGNAGAGSSMADDFLKIALEKHPTNTNTTILVELFKELQKAGAEFGYRSASEINELIGVLDLITKDQKEWDGIEIITENDFVDIAIMQKLLPKLHGSRNKLTKVLPVLGGFCLSDNSKIKEDYLDKFVNNSFTDAVLKADTNIKYKISFEKICRMYKNAVENGFASYAEA